jgi:WD40 repeat protein
VLRSDNGYNYYNNSYSNITLIDLDSFQVKSSWPDPPTDSSSDREVNAMLACWTPDSRCVITSNDEIVGGNLLPKLHVWDAESGRLLRSMSPGNSWIQSICCDPAGKRLFSGTRDGDIQIWSLPSGELIGRFHALLYGLDSFYLSPNAEFLFCVGLQDEASVFDIQTRKQILAFDHLDSKIISVDFPEPLVSL